MAFACTVVTPEQPTFDGQVTQAILPAHDGLIGILTDRAPLLVQLGIGPLRLDLPDGSKKFYLLDGGIAQMKDNKLTVLTELATLATEIDYEAARAQYAEAAARKAVTEPEKAERAREMERARAAQQMAGRN